jgi:hypothetical protein
MSIVSDSKRDLRLRPVDADRIAGGRMTPIWTGKPAASKHLLAILKRRRGE